MESKRTGGLLTDEQIIALFFAREERAIVETEKKYCQYLHTVAYNILYSKEDCDECLNDTYLGAWDKIPPERPSHLKAFLTTIVRRVSINRYNEKTRQKRVPSALTDALDELEILLLRSDPRSDLGKIKSECHTSLDRLAVLFRIYEELTLSDKTVRSAETVQHFIHSHDLIRSIRRA